MDALLVTRHLRLRYFTPGDAGLLFELDADPAVMRFIAGGPGTPRTGVDTEILPAFLAYYRRPRGYGFWGSNSWRPVNSSGGSTSARRREGLRTNPNPDTGCGFPPGATAWERSAR